MGVQGDGENNMLDKIEDDSPGLWVQEHARLDLLDTNITSLFMI